MTDLQIIWTEALGSFVLIVLGCGVVANVVLKGSKGFGGGWLLIAMGWGFAVYAGVVLSGSSAPHLNAAVTAAFLVLGEVSLGQAACYVLGQFIGCLVGAVAVWVIYYGQLNSGDSPAEEKLAVFATGPSYRSYPVSLFAEAIATFVLVLGILVIGGQDGVLVAGLGAFPAGLLVMVIVASLGGQTGTAINPTRDLCPRLVHALLPISGKGDSQWRYSAVPVLGPILGGVLGAGVFTLLPL